MQRPLLASFLLLALLGSAWAIQFHPRMANHTAADAFDRLPADTVRRAQSELKVAFMHSGMGGHILAGLEVLRARNATLSYSRTSQPLARPPTDSLSIVEPTLGGVNDLTAGPNSSSWYAATREYLRGEGRDRNVVIWSWGEDSPPSEDVGTWAYINNMVRLETEFPNVTFVYMTEPLGAAGEVGDKLQHNALIRRYAADYGKPLYDFADIESWDPAGVYHPGEITNCLWCRPWCAQGGRDCPAESVLCYQSHPTSCVRKAQAFWGLMAMLVSVDPKPFDPRAPAPPAANGSLPAPPLSPPSTPPAGFDLGSLALPAVLVLCALALGLVLRRTLSHAPEGDPPQNPPAA